MRPPEGQGDRIGEADDCADQRVDERIGAHGVLHAVPRAGTHLRVANMN